MRLAAFFHDGERKQTLRISGQGGWHLRGPWVCGVLFVGMACARAQVVSVAQRGGHVEVSGSADFPSGRSAQIYTTSAVPGHLTDPLARQLADEIDSSSKSAGRVSLIHDARLDRVAYDIAFLTADMNVPASDAIAFLLGYYGLVEPEPNLILIKGSDGAEPSAVTDLHHQIATISSAGAWRRVGIGVRRRSGGWSAVLAFNEQNLDLQPVPRRLSATGETVIAGHVGPLFRAPEVLVTSPKGTVRKLVTSSQKRAFSARFQCHQGPGVYQVEVNAEDVRGPTVVANFPLYCGVDPPSRFATRAPVALVASDAASSERQILDLLDRDRAAHGLPALIRDPRLAEIARRYSREMAGTGEVAHFSRRSGNALDRVRAARISPMPTIIAENVGRDYSAADAERGFMASPGHRDNILNPGVTHVGVGVEIGKPEGGAAPLFFTQLFAGWGQ